MNGLMMPFLDLARWIHRRMPARWRGLVVLRLGEEVTGAARLRLDVPEGALLWRAIERPARTGTGSDTRAEAALAARVADLSPWAPGAFHWAVSETDGRVALVAAAPIEAVRHRVTALGGDLVEVTGAGGKVWLIEDQAGQVRLARRLAAAWLAVMVLGVGLAGFAWMDGQGAEANLAQAEARLAKVLARAESGSATARAARDLVNAMPRATARMNDLAAALPLDSYAETLQITPEGFTLSGQSARPEEVIPALEAAGPFGTVDFAGASTLDPQSGLYSFSVSGTFGGQR